MNSNDLEKQLNEQLGVLYDYLKSSDINQKFKIPKEAIERLPVEQANHIKTLMNKKNEIIAITNLVRKTTKEEFVQVISSPDSIAIKLSPQEMQAICGGGDWFSLCGLCSCAVMGASLTGGVTVMGGIAACAGIVNVGNKLDKALAAD